MGTELCPECGHPTKVYADAVPGRKHNGGCSLDRPWWRKENYLAGKEIGGGLWVCMAQMVTTVRIMVCTPAPEGALHEFWCYPDPWLAYVAYSTFDGKGDPGIGWVKHHPSHRRNCPSCYTNVTHDEDCENPWHEQQRLMQRA